MRAMAYGDVRGLGVATWRGMPQIPLACELPPPDPKNLVAILVRALPAVFLVGFPTVLVLGLVIGPRRNTAHFSCGESTGEIASMVTAHYAYEAFPQWARADPSRP